MISIRKGDRDVFEFDFTNDFRDADELDSGSITVEIDPAGELDELVTSRALTEKVVQIVLDSDAANLRDYLVTVRVSNLTDDLTHTLSETFRVYP